MGLLIEQLDMSNAESDYELGGIMDTAYSVINNACWSCGEIALKQGKSWTRTVRLVSVLT